MNPMRRHLLQLAMLATVAVSMPALAVGTPVQVVYHIVEGNDQAAQALMNIRNHLAAEPDTKIVVVALGGGVDFLLEGAKDRYGQAFDAKVAALSSQGVQFRVCKNTLMGRKIDPSKVLLEAKVVSSGVAEIARLQAREGFAYIRP